MTWDPEGRSRAGRPGPPGEPGFGAAHDPVLTGVARAFAAPPRPPKVDHASVAGDLNAFAALAADLEGAGAAPPRLDRFLVHRARGRLDE